MINTSTHFTCTFPLVQGLPVAKQPTGPDDFDRYQQDVNHTEMANNFVTQIRQTHDWVMSQDGKIDDQDNNPGSVLVSNPSNEMFSGSMYANPTTMIGKAGPKDYYFQSQNVEAHFAPGDSMTAVETTVKESGAVETVSANANPHQITLEYNLAPKS